MKWSRNATAYLGSVLVSSFGSNAMMLAAGIWVMALTGDSSLAAWVGFLVWAPTLAGPVIGAVVDRAPRRQRVMIGANTVMGLLLLLLLLVETDTQVWLIFAVMLCYGISFVILDAAENAVLPAAVPADQLGDLNGLRMSASEGVKLAAPLLGAGLFTWLGGAGVAVLDAATFFVAAALCLLIRPGRIEPTPAAEPWRQRIAEGARQLWRHPVLRRIILSTSSLMFLVGMAGTTVFAVVDEGLHRTPAFAGVLMTVQGAGSVAAGLLAGPLQRRMRPHVFAGTGIALFAAGAALRCLPSLTPVLVAALLAGLAAPWVLITGATVLQREIPAAYLGRVSGTVTLLSFAPGAIGQATGASLLAVADYRLLLGGAAVAGLATAVLCLRPVRAEAPAPVR